MLSVQNKRNLKIELKNLCLNAVYCEKNKSRYVNKSIIVLSDINNKQEVKSTKFCKIYLNNTNNEYNTHVLINHTHI